MDFLAVIFFDCSGYLSQSFSWCQMLSLSTTRSASREIHQLQSHLSIHPSIYSSIHRESWCWTNTGKHPPFSVLDQCWWMCVIQSKKVDDWREISNQKENEFSIHFLLCAFGLLAFAFDVPKFLLWQVQSMTLNRIYFSFFYLAYSFGPGRVPSPWAVLDRQPGADLFSHSTEKIPKPITCDIDLRFLPLFSILSFYDSCLLFCLTSWSNIYYYYIYIHSSTSLTTRGFFGIQDRKREWDGRPPSEKKSKRSALTFDQFYSLPRAPKERRTADSTRQIKWSKCTSI